MARIINALLLFGGYLYADRAARRLRMKVWRPKHVEFILNVLFVVQWAISAYLWICGLLCFWHFMREPGFLPTFQVQFFP